MIRCDALVVGGGPAGSTCARDIAPRRLGRRARRSRARSRATRSARDGSRPACSRLLDLDPAEYRDAGLTLQEITAFRTGVIGGRLIETRYPRVVSYAIRRCEFDEFLLRRAGVRVLEGTCRSPRCAAPAADGSPTSRSKRRSSSAPAGISARSRRHLRGSPDTSPPIVAKEAEFRLDDRGAADAAHPPELLFCRDLEGYALVRPQGRRISTSASAGATAATSGARQALHRAPRGRRRAAALAPI